MLMLSAIVISAGGKMEAGAVAAVAMAVEMVELLRELVNQDF